MIGGSNNSNTYTTFEEINKAYNIFVEQNHKEINPYVALKEKQKILNSLLKYQVGKNNPVNQVKNINNMKHILRMFHMFHIVRQILDEDRQNRMKKKFNNDYSAGTQLTTNIPSEIIPKFDDVLAN